MKKPSIKERCHFCNTPRQHGGHNVQLLNEKTGMFSVWTCSAECRDAIVRMTRLYAQRNRS